MIAYPKCIGSGRRDFFAMILASLILAGGAHCQDPIDQESNTIRDAERLRVGLAYVDDDGESVLYSALEAEGAKISISDVDDLLQVWSQVCSDDPKKRYIAAAALSFHLRKLGFEVERSLVRITHDPQSKHHRELLGELRHKASRAWKLTPGKK